MARRFILLAASMTAVLIAALAQDAPQPTGQRGAATPEQRAAATRAFLGLGPAPDKEAAARGAPLYQQNCAFCHGAQARGAEGPNLVVSDVVLGDDHGEHLTPFLKKGRPEKGMPGFPALSDDQLRDISEFVHLQVEDVANRGTYHLENIVVGNAEAGKAYVAKNCTNSCHTVASFDHIATKFRTPELLQRDWVWPNRPNDGSLAVTATVKTPDGVLSGPITQISDFKVTLKDSTGQTHVIERGPGVSVETRDPLDPHQELIMTLKNDDLHNVTAYLETLK